MTTFLTNNYYETPSILWLRAHVLQVLVSSRRLLLPKSSKLFEDLALTQNLIFIIWIQAADVI